MKDVALPEAVDFYRIDASLKLDAKRRAALGQYMTPVPISRFMASLFSDTHGDLRVLDPGAGVGSLTAALAERLCDETACPHSVEFVCYELDGMLIGYLTETLRHTEALFQRTQVSVESQLFEKDFILEHGVAQQQGLFEDQGYTDGGFSHVILNPPYRKIKTDSAHRKALRSAGLETSNLYTGFMFVAARHLREGGQMVAIIPRSFCNGPYFRPFRQQFFSMMRLRHIHVFERRNHAFKDDAVLQENIIVHAIKGGPTHDVTITTSCGDALEFDPTRGMCVAEDLTQRTVPLSSVIRDGDPDRFVHIAVDGIEQGIMDRMAKFTASLADIGVEVSTGPVVDFRLKEDLRPKPEDGAVPLLYPAHFRGGSVSWPKAMRKPNAIRVSAASRKWLWANGGSYVVVRRFTSKEEPRRVVAAVYGSELPGDLVGFENHLNVFHVGRVGMPSNLAAGLALFLNCTLVDRYFRQFNGHTQVNATDLRWMRYPDRTTLERLGELHNAPILSQQAIDTIIERQIAHMFHDENPLAAQQKIDEAISILKALEMPRGQQNARSALTLLALVDLRPSGKWTQLRRPLMGITPIMDYTREHYGREYAPNTRETFRRQTMHQFVEAGIALYNPDDPARPVNSPNACYQVSAEALRVMRAFDTPGWSEALKRWLRVRVSLTAKWERNRAMQMIPAKVAPSQEIMLTPGAHSELISEILSSFAPRFAPGADVIYVGDTGNKFGHFQEERLASLGVTIDRHGKMPDVVLYFGEKNWLLLVESVTSHGPMDAKRHDELADLFGAAQPGLIYVTAFPNRTVMSRHLSEISWETEVWCADSPSHLIHFDGERFLEPYEDTGVSEAVTYRPGTEAEEEGPR